MTYQAQWINHTTYADRVEIDLVVIDDEGIRPSLRQTYNFRLPASVQNLVSYERRAKYRDLPPVVYVAVPDEEGNTAPYHEPYVTREYFSLEDFPEGTREEEDAFLVPHPLSVNPLSLWNEDPVFLDEIATTLISQSIHDQDMEAIVAHFAEQARVATLQAAPPIMQKVAEAASKGARAITSDPTLISNFTQLSLAAASPALIKVMEEVSVSAARRLVE